MRIIKIDKNNQVNGPGLRCVVWMAGCSHKCVGCHNPETWDENGGHEYTCEDNDLIYEQLNRSEISGVTLTGGDPLNPFNIRETTELCAWIKSQFPDKTIWCYTGYLYEEVKDYPIMQYIDVLVDGPFVQSLYAPGLLWRGSSNQRLIDIKKSTDNIVEYSQKF